MATSASKPMLEQAAAPLLLFGGSFDPVHNAHIDVALAASGVLHHAPVTFLPNARSPLKDAPGASNAQRLAMLELALSPFPELHLSRFEIERPAPSFMIDTLHHFRAQQGQAPLILIMGADSFGSLQHWRDWQNFPALCHLLVLPRPEAANPTDSVLDAFPEADTATLLERPSGHRLMLDAPLIDLSSTHLRTELAQGITSLSLPPAVAHYIHEHHLYCQ